MKTKTPDVAIIHQLVPFDGKWEFQYLHNDHYSAGDGMTVQRCPILGLALIDLPVLDWRRMVVHFGMNEESVTLYTPFAWCQSKYLYPFFQNGFDQRALGIAPVGSTDDYFAEEIVWAREQLEAEKIYRNKLVALYRLPEKLGLPFSARMEMNEGIDNFFAIKTGRFRDNAGRREWDVVIPMLDNIRSCSGDRALLDTILGAARTPTQDVLDRAFETATQTVPA